jgi:hypothetical protein
MMRVDAIDGYIPVKWPDRSRGPFVAQLKLGEQLGRFQIIAIALGSVKDNRPITGTVLRQVRVAELAMEVADVLLRLDVSSRLEPGQLVDDTYADGAPLDATFRKRRAVFWARGRVAAARERAALAATAARPVSHDDQEIVRIYSEAFRAGRPPRLAVAQALGISPDAAAKRIWRIRHSGSGLLPETKQGKAAGQARKRRNA